jgi:putative ABC transport system permease protein
MVLLRLAMSNFKVRRVRTTLTVAAIALSVSLVVSVTSGYKSIHDAALKFLNRYMGTADAMITSVDPIQGMMPESIAKELRDDPSVSQVTARLESARQLERAQGQEGPKRTDEQLQRGAAPADKIYVDLIGARRPEDTAILSMDLRKGKWFDKSTGDEAVLDQVGAEKLGVDIGSSVTIPPGGHEASLTVKIVGIVHKPVFFAQRAATMYLPIETLQHFTGQDKPPLVSTISINLHTGVDESAFEKAWVQKLVKIDPALRLRLRPENSGDVERNLRGLQIAAYLGGTVAMLTATFIIFSALSMGVSERQRTLAMLRAVGAVRTQIVNLVIIEALSMAVTGIVIGIPLGMLWIDLLDRKFSDLFAVGVTFSIAGMVFAAIGSLFSALVASLLPAWWASRISPLEAMNVHSGSTGHKPPIGWAILGIILVSIDPFFFFGPIERMAQWIGFSNPESVAGATRFVVHFALGLPGIMIGFFLLAPMFVWVIEHAMSPILAGILGLPTRLVRQQLSTGIWRAAGTAAALMVGLATLIALQVQGHTLIGGWKLPDKFPDIFIWSPDIISWDDQKTLANVQGIEPGTLMPIVVTTPAGDSKLSLALASTIAGQEVGTMFFAVDPKQAMKMIQLDFRDDSGVSYPPDQQYPMQEHVEQITQAPRHVIVTDEFRQAHHLKVGDKFPLRTTVHGSQEYTISAIVWSPGADVLVSMFDLGHLLTERTQGSVFGSLDDAKRDFGATGARLFAANLQGGIDKAVLLKNVQKALGDRGLAAGDVRQIKYGIENTFYRILDLISTVAIAAMALASLGVTNTIMASVRSRRWQFGILRSVGLVRGELLRLILAEAIMLGLVGIVLGLIAGLEIAVDARQLTWNVLGYNPPMQIPWGIVAGGCTALMGVALGASFMPALGVARAQPLELLQAGRAAG